jgi:hypothetical protein
MDKLIVFLLLLLILINVLIVLRLSKKQEDFTDLNLTDADKAIPLWRVFAFLEYIGLPRELSMEYAGTLLAVDPKQQPELDEIIALMKNNSIHLNNDDLQKIEKVFNIPLQPIGLVNSLNYLRAHKDANKIFKAYNDFNYLVLNKMREKNNVTY